MQGLRYWAVLLWASVAFPAFPSSQALELQGGGAEDSQDMDIQGALAKDDGEFGAGPLTLDEQTNVLLGEVPACDGEGDDEEGGSPLKAAMVTDEIAQFRAEHLHAMTMDILGLGGAGAGDSDDELADSAAPAITHEDLAAAGADKDEDDGDEFLKRRKRDDDEEDAAAGEPEEGGEDDEEDLPAPKRAAKATFGRGRPRKQQRCGSAAADAAPAAPADAAGAVRSEAEAKPQPISEVGPYKLELLALPEAAWPLRPPRGAANYTLTGACGAKIEVQLKVKAFRVRSSAGAEPVLVNWAKFGGPANAWDFATQFGQFQSV